MRWLGAVGQLTVKIESVAKHLENNRKDVFSRRALETLVQKRRRLMLYLKRHDIQQYGDVCTTLNLRSTPSRLEQPSRFHSVR